MEYIDVRTNVLRTNVLRTNVLKQRCSGVSGDKCPYFNKRNIELIKNIDEIFRCKSCTMKQSIKLNYGIDILNQNNDVKRPEIL